jgi:peptidoglycan-N-acetylglucosamine deacetylase
MFRRMILSVVLASAAVATLPAAAPSALDAPIAAGLRPTAPPSTPIPSAAPTPVPSPVVGPVTATVHRHGARDAKLVALTFDDGWNLREVRRIVDVLTRTRTPATFFPVGRAVLRYPDLWRTISAAGFPIGDHSWNHADLRKKSHAGALKDITKARDAIEGVIRRPLLSAFRPPYGAWDDELVKAAGDAGFQAIVLWDVDPEDWTGEAAKVVTRKALHAKAGSIVVMHTDKPNTATALPKIIRSLRARGYTLVTVGELLGIGGDVPVFPIPAGRGRGR